MVFNLLHFRLQSCQCSFGFNHTASALTEVSKITLIRAGRVSLKAEVRGTWSYVVFEGYLLLIVGMSADCSVTLLVITAVYMLYIA